jgi:hypothetical protein
MAEKVQKKVNEESMLDLIMCPYYGNGVKDTRRLDKYLTKLKTPQHKTPPKDLSPINNNYLLPTINVPQMKNLVKVLKIFLIGRRSIEFKK